MQIFKYFKKARMTIILSDKVEFRVWKMITM